MLLSNKVRYRSKLLRGDCMLKTKAFVISEPGKGATREFEMPELKSEDVLVKVKACGVCTTDRRIFAGKVKVPYPVIGGHEISGEVVDVGSKVKDIELGAKVTIDAINRCGHCYYCIRGFDNLCVNARKGRKLEDVFLIAGGFSEYIIANRKQIFTLNEETDFLEAAMSEPLACCIHSVKKAKLTLGDSVLIIGAGTMGILHAFVTRLRGAKAIISDPDPKRREVATKNGFETIDPEQLSKTMKHVNNGMGFDAVFITAPALEVINESLSYIRKNGIIVVYTSLHPSGNIIFDSNLLHYSEAIITGTEGRTMEDFREATMLISNSIVDMKPLVTKTISLEQLSEELRSIPSGEKQRTVVSF